MSSALNKLGAASEERKARLAQLKNLKRKQPAGEVVAPESERSPAEPEEKVDIARLHLSGRNYDAETKGPKLGFEAPPTIGLESQTLEEQAADIEADIRQQAAEEAANDKGIDLFKLQPKKPNWDLKRNLDAKLEILNVRTDNAIARLVVARISAERKAKQSARTENNNDNNNTEADNEGVDGVALVEGLRIREQEEKDEELREKREEEAEE